MRIDFFFSYWIFLWYLLYELRFTTYNPKIALVLGILENIILFSVMVYVNQSLFHLIGFCFTNTILKVIPLWSLWNTPYRWKDFYAFVVLFMIFVGWLYVNGLLTIDVLKTSLQKLEKNEPVGPLTYYVDKYLKV
jgi:hypothetical protein